MTSTTIRRATAKDVPALTQIRNDAHEKKVAHCDYACMNRRFVRLDCDAGNARLCAYYESLGFKRAGLKPMPGSGAYIWSLYEQSVLQLSSRRP